MSSTVDDGRDPRAYGDRGILSLCSISRCSMSAVGGVSHPCGGSVFQRGAERTRIHTYKTAEMVSVYMLEGGRQQDQFRLRFHPPIVGSALDVCQWVSKPNRSFKTFLSKRTCDPLRFLSARSRSCDFPDPPVLFPAVQFIPKPQHPLPSTHPVLIVSKVSSSNGPKIRRYFPVFSDDVSGQLFRSLGSQ